MFDILISIGITFYCIVFPFLTAQFFNDSKARTFLRFYFAKRKCITWFAYIILIVIGSGALVYYFLFNIIISVGRFLFVSKRCKKIKRTKEIK